MEDLSTAGEIRRASNQGAVMQLEVIEQDGEKYVVLPDEVLEQCGVGGIVDISVENGCVVLKTVDNKERQRLND
ncbi:hypothetical protein [Ghiorsea bivora]|uniref:hypothetical protein n=1 Tax=Ghiorsea bivora TaxID=1485545 RepID=UPI0012FDAF1E|nr:hypothetical protein [Ghiorsea bivora]